MGPPNELRKAGLLEHLHILRYEIGYDHCLVTSAKYSSVSGGSLDRSVVLRALKRVVLAHPALCVQIAGDAIKGPYFVRLPSVDLNQVLGFYSYPGKTLEEVYNAEINTHLPLRTQKPLWRVTVHEDNAIIFAFGHDIGDGASAHAIHLSMLSALNEADGEFPDDEETFVVDVPADVSLVPSMDERISLAMPFFDTYMSILSLLLPTFLKSGYTAWTGAPIAAPSLPPVVLRLQHLPAERAKALVMLCREHGCTLTSFIQTLAVRVLSFLLLHYFEGHSGYKTFCLNVPISLRRFTGVSPLDMCDHVSQYQSYTPIMRHIKHPITEGFPWDVARKYGQALHSSVESSPQQVGKLELIFSMGQGIAFLESQFRKKRDITIQLSNIGVVPKREYQAAEVKGPWRLDNVCLAHGAITGALMQMNTAGSPSGAVEFAYTWTEGAINQDLAQAFVTEMGRAMVDVTQAL